MFVSCLSDYRPLCFYGKIIFKEAFKIKQIDSKRMFQLVIPKTWEQSYNAISKSLNPLYRIWNTEFYENKLFNTNVTINYKYSLE